MQPESSHRTAHKSRTPPPIGPDREATENALQQGWPSFLDLLDSDPERAWTEFYEFARKALSIMHILRTFGPDAMWDWIHDINIHCCRDDFKKLRTYRPREKKTFAGWLHTVALHYLIDQGAYYPPATEEPDENLPVPGPPAMERQIYRDLLERVQRRLAQMDEKCRRLLKLASEGRKPLEITKILNLPEKKNKEISERIINCRSRLARALRRDGIDLKTVFT
ncbi:MAG TPA: sigma-70 family RNA polymerase sigma factor [Candidatus Polarisedimenticolia bacterium]|jgi:DNA-directed RNA polymerase specialized sigma24 family protein|nr:sigma-70 family RNA polymerase sigma factor [Candidatus Polarisedimenticolia bacterium]